MTLKKKNRSHFSNTITKVSNTLQHKVQKIHSLAWWASESEQMLMNSAPNKSTCSHWLHRHVISLSHSSSSEVMTTFGLSQSTVLFLFSFNLFHVSLKRIQQSKKHIFNMRSKWNINVGTRHFFFFFWCVYKTWPTNIWSLSAMRMVTIWIHSRIKSTGAPQFMRQTN